MPEYEVRRFDTELSLDSGEEIAAASLSAQGTRTSQETASNFALVRLADDDDAVEASEGVEDYICGRELDSGDVCQRAVGSPQDFCWQHEP